MEGTTITSAVLHYVSSRRASRELTAHTAKGYRGVLLGFAESAGMRRDITTITRADVERWFAEQVETIRETTLRHYYATVRGFFEWAVETGMIQKSPCAGIDGPRAQESIPRSMRSDDIARVFAACETERERLMVSLMVQEGLRCCEVARLEIADVDLSEGIMRVMGKGSRERWLPITSETQAAMRAYLATVTPRFSGPFLRKERGDTDSAMDPNYVSKLMTRLMNRAGVKGEARDGVSAHALRHTFASSLLDEGVDIEDVRLALGHSTLTSTAVYTKRNRASTRLRAVMDGRRFEEATA